MMVQGTLIVKVLVKKVISSLVQQDNCLLHQYLTPPVNKKRGNLVQFKRSNSALNGLQLRSLNLHSLT